MYEKYKVHIVYVPFDLVHFGNDQALYCKSLSPHSEVYDISSIGYPKYEDVIHIISKAELFITTRYHGLVLALANKTPVIHIVNTTYGKYGQIKAESITESNFPKLETKELQRIFMGYDFSDVLKNVVVNYDNILFEQANLFESDNYINGRSWIKTSRQNVIKSYVTL